MVELRAGRTDMLFSLFPWLVPELSTPQPDQELTHEIARLRELIISQGTMPALTPPRPATPDDELDLRWPSQRLKAAHQLRIFKLDHEFTAVRVKQWTISINGPKNYLIKHWGNPIPQRGRWSSKT